jgi:predicted regulator of Ras-like GTPase activity (Roadblock/LC7/MglB family)
MKGSLEDMAVADIIQHNCHSQKAARVELKAQRQRAELYFRNGNLVHATLGDQTGEDVVYRVLGWDEGNFSVHADVESPEISIVKSWSSLLLEGVRRLDEDEGAGEQQNGDTLGLDAAALNGFAAPLDSAAAAEDPRAQLQDHMHTLAEQTEGFMLAALSDLRGRMYAGQAGPGLDAEGIVDQASHYLKTVTRAVARLGHGDLEDNLLTTEKARLVARFLPRSENFLLLAAHKGTANIGSMRHLADVYATRFSEFDLERLFAEGDK